MSYMLIICDFIPHLRGECHFDLVEIISRNREIRKYKDIKEENQIFPNPNTLHISECLVHICA